MDTDELTEMAYASIWLGNEATDVLKSELGAMCSNFGTEDDYLRGIFERAKRIEARPKSYLKFWNLLECTDMASFRAKIKVLREHIEKTLATSIEERGKTAW